MKYNKIQIKNAINYWKSVLTESKKTKFSKKVIENTINYWSDKINLNEWSRGGVWSRNAGSKIHRDDRLEHNRQDLSKRKGSIANILMDHRDEVLFQPDLRSLIKTVEDLFTDNDIHTPYSISMLNTLRAKRKYEDALLYVHNVMQKGMGN